MSEENKIVEVKQECFCQSKGFRKFLTTALGTFVGVYCALSLFAALHKPPMPPKMNLDEQLKLTDEQKAQAKELRMQAREQMKPIVEALKTKQEQKQIIKRNQSLTAEAQCEQVEKLNAEIVELKKQAREIRLKNQKDFEAILTEKQKKELQKIKTNARKEMMKKHKKCPPRAHKK